MACADCGAVLHEGQGPLPPALSGENDTPRTACPECGSTARSYQVELNSAVEVVGSVALKVQQAWNSDRLAVLLFLLALLPAVGLTIGIAVGSVVWGIISGFAAVLLGAVVLWACLRGPLARIAAEVMHRISGR